MFYWVLLCFIELGISSTGFDRVLLGFTGLGISSTRYGRVLLGFTGFNWDLLG